MSLRQYPQRKRTKKWLIILLLLFWLTNFKAVAAKPLNKVAEMPVETSLLKLPPVKTSANKLKLVGQSQLKLKEIEVAFLNQARLSWNGSQWLNQKSWLKYKIKLAANFTWQTTFKLPKVNGEVITVLLRAVTTDGNTDPTPLSFKIKIDNLAPVVKQFSLDQAGLYVNKREVNLLSDVPEATKMRLASSKAKLKKAKWQTFSLRATYKLPTGDGQKHIWAAYADAFGNETQKKMTVYLDTAPPVINKLMPGDKATAIDVNATLKVQFIEGTALDMASFNSQTPIFYLLNAQGQVVPADINYYQGSKTLILTPKEPLERNQLYTAFLTTALKDLAGNSLENNFSWSFKAITSAAPETKLLTLLKQPVTRSTLLIKGSASHPEGVKKVLISLQNQEGKFWQPTSSTWTTEPVEAEINFSDAAKKVRLFQRQLILPSLDNESIYLKVAAVNKFDAVDPTPIGQTIIVDNQPPLIEELALDSGAQVTAKPDIIISLKGVKKADFVKLAENLKELKTKSYLPFTPTVNFSLSNKQGLKTVYFQFKDKAGNETKIASLKVYYDKAGPKVRATFPAKDAVNVNTSVMLTVNFNELALDTATVNNQTFTLFNSNDETVPAQVRFDPLSNMATLMPLKDLNYGAAYTAKVSGEIKDKLGNRLGKDYVWQFRTINLSTHPPGAPRGVKVVASDKANLIRWQVVSPATDNGGDFNPPTQGGYNIYRSLNAQGPYEKINLVPIASTSYVDDSFDRSAIYFYLVKAIDAGGHESLNSKPQPNDLVAINKRIKAESSATITAANGLVEIALPKVGWQRQLQFKVFNTNELKSKNIKLNSYEMPFLGQIYQLNSNRALGGAQLKVKLAGNGQNAKFAKKTESGWKLLTEGRYQYDTINQALAYEPLTEGGLLAVINQDDVTPPPTPTKVLSKFKSGQVYIQWSKVVDFDSGISGYNLTKLSELSETSETLQLPSDNNTYVDTNVQPGQEYVYLITAVNGSGLESTASEVLVQVPTDLKVGHRPKIKTRWSCSDCHLVKGKLSKKTLFCYLCHDGSGSKFIVQGYSAKAPYYCQSCHQLSKKSLQKYQAYALNSQNSATNLCLNCHQQQLKTSLEATATKGHDDCRSCHSLHRPRGRKNLFLANPTNTLKNWQGSETNFCLTCHQEKLFLPAVDRPGKFRPKTVTFSNNISLPLFSGWNKSLFKQAVHVNFSSCLTCHRIHTNTANLLVFRSGKKYVKLPLGTESEFICYQCHRASGWPQAQDILSLQNKSVSHLNQAFNLHSNKETTSSFTLNRHASCADCHNVHSLTKQKRLPFSNKISGALMGVGGVDFTTEKAGVTPSPYVVKSAQYEYQICFKCHTWTKENQLSQVVLDFNRGNVSFHPVTAQGKNKGIKRESFVNGWTYLATMYCSDCHNNDDTKQAQGPHGSNNKYLLKQPYVREATSTSQELCFACHNRKVYQEGAKGSRFAGANGHKGHAEKNVKCYDCHETHGSAFQPHLLKIKNATETSGLVNFTHDETGGSCLASCHQDPAKIAIYQHRY